MKFCLEFQIYFYFIIIRPIFYILMLIFIEIVLELFSFWWKTHVFYRLEDSDDAEKIYAPHEFFLRTQIFFYFFLHPAPF